MSEGTNKLLAVIAVIAGLGLVWEAQKAEPIRNDRGKAARVTSTADTPPEGGIGVGETAVLSEGAARVFVSRVAEDGARVAVNGVETATLAVGDTAAVGDSGCAVSLDAVGGGKASFSYACDG